MSLGLFAHVLVPYDFTPAADETLRTAAKLAAAAGGDLTVLHVIAPFYPLRDLAYAGPEVLDAHALEARVLARLEGRVASLVGGTKVRCLVTMGNPGHRIVEGATGMSSIVMPTAGRTGAAHALMGSTAERVVRFSPVPVLVIPPARRGTQRPAGKSRERRTARRRLAPALAILLAVVSPAFGIYEDTQLDYGYVEATLSF